MSLEISYGKPLLRNPSSRTGVSIRDGIPIESVEDLPEHWIEVHVLKDATEASVFVAGLETAGTGNAMAYDWDHGDLADNRVVLIARFDVPRPDGDRLDDVVKLVRPISVHEIDVAARRRDTDAQLDADRRRHAADLAEMQDVLEPLRQRGATIGRSGPRWFEFSLDDCHGTASWDRDGGPVRVTVGMWDTFQNSPLFEEELRRACIDLASEEGMGFKDDELIIGDLGRDAVADAARRVMRIESRLKEVEGRLIRARFEEGFRLTPKRARFLEGAMEDGIRVHHGARGRSRARAGGIEIMWGELEDMVRRGWVEKRSRLDYGITDDGREAVNERLQGASPRP